jgi:hypothetical protein
MSESWRQKRYYKPRILVSTAETLDSDIPGGLVCLTGEQINLLRSLLEYAERRSTFVSEYHDGYYLAPSEDEWEDIVDVVARTQENLMACTDIETLLEAIRDCVCTAARNEGAPALTPIDGQPDYDNYDSDVEEGEGDPPGELEDWEAWEVYRCKAAQMILDDVYNTVQNWEEWATLAGSITFAAVETALVGSLVGIPLAIVMLIVAFFTTNLVDWVWDNVLTWLLNNKQALVCEIVNSATAAAARTAVHQYIEDEWPYTQRYEVLQWAFSKRVVAYAFDADMPDYATRQSSYSASYCDPCVEPEIGSDWWAMPLSPEGNTIEMPHPEGNYWQNGCWQYEVADGQMICGYVFEVIKKTGGKQLKRMGSAEAGCTGSQLTGNTNESLTLNEYFAANGTNIDESECKTAIAPSATDLTDPDISRRTGVEVNQGFQLGWSGVDDVTIVFTWAIFEGTTPP